ncbi:related to SEE1 - probable lysine methyltransferase [Melanopsichium pennsylvanicum]|uniref:Protein-lysine N-methyltransferase EFM4 n=2 Tax=Melanopsichium pennsylvanicum TaxID=63383 RepID=A0AAJ4XJN1_9BASI|nr:n-acyl-phosphatidylethanolamine-hydrolyzing phospholipase d [Melanopsichium pennsylvanicum 4]SNX82976.1 related to SEE1 - probable lysine methyltransferase [Melanopsichium pennsylvanicum]
MSSTTTSSWSVSKSESIVAPSYYQTSPPPHWTNSDTSKRKFKSPWPSAEAHGILGFIRARLFDWDEVPLPPRTATSSGSAVLPPVHRPTWIAADSPSTQESITFTWLGHAICHLQIPIGNGRKITILCDPVLSRRVSPVQWFGPERYTDAPVTVEQIASATVDNGKHAWPDLLVLSHNHYDHMDYNTIQALLNPTNPGVKRPHVFCTLGNKSWFTSEFGLTVSEVTECDWWNQFNVSLNGEEVLKVTCVPAQHFSGRGLTDRDRTLWAGYTFHTISPGSPKSSTYFAGDTGYRTVPRGMPREKEDSLPCCPAFKEIGDNLGPFDVSLIPIGAYLPRNVMSTVHLAPQDSVLVHRDVKSKKSYGIHWGSFRLTPEDVNEPPKLLAEEAKRAGIDPGEFEVIGIGESVSIPLAASNTTTATTSTLATAQAQAVKETEYLDGEPLPESRLGTKQHWDSVYAREVSVFNDIGEEGEVWFGEDAVARMIRFLEEYYTETIPDVHSSDLNPPSVLDLGTGNGHLLFEMIESSADLEDIIRADRLVGIDYSEASINLARSIALKRGGNCEEVNFQTADLLDNSAVASLRNMPKTHFETQDEAWDLVCDKGTLDAIALSSKPINNSLPIDLYTTAVKNLVKPKGIFLITSCNFTEQELTQRFTQAGFQVEKVLPVPSFTFGGAKGSTTTSIAFRKL